MKARRAALACLVLVSIALVGQSKPSDEEAKSKLAKAPSVPGAFVTSQRVVYAVGQPIDITFSINSGKGEVVPGFTIMDATGIVAPARQNNGKYLWEAAGRSIDSQERDGVIPPDCQHTEVIRDLREWYQFESPGMYDVAFDGGWIDADGKLHPVASNKILIKIADNSGENRDTPEMHEIPLAEIWALDMPGTAPMVTSLSAVDPPVYRSPEGRLVSEIRRKALQGNSNLAQPAPKGFMVRGHGMDAHI